MTNEKKNEKSLFIGGIFLGAGNPLRLLRVQFCGHQEAPPSHPILGFTEAETEAPLTMRLSDLS